MKFINSFYNAKTGESKVIMQHLGTKFTGISKMHPEEPIASQFVGCEYAEIRAAIKALKHERKLAKMKSDMALDFVKSCECYSKFNKNDDTAKVMYRQLNKRIGYVNKITDEINELMSILQDKMETRAKVIKTKAISNRIINRSKEDNK